SEEVRELLSAYFDRCKRLIERYGGTVEKFIGDAVMAVWGTPVAMEDDAERAVRAGFELLATVSEIDPHLQARAGVLTGEAAVTLGAEGQGMVAGDLVNTASRIQSEAQPGTVLVGEATRRASSRVQPSSLTSPTRRNAPGSSPGSPTCSASRRASPATRRTSSPRGASCSSGWPRSTRSSSSSRTCSGRTRASSTSSTTC